MGTSNGARLIKATRSRIDLERVMMEPLVRFELTTVRLQGGCSTTELKRHGNEVAHIYRRWPVVASRKWIVRHGYFHFKRLKTFQESNREPCSSGGSAGGSSKCGAVSGCSVSAEGAGEPSVRSAVAEGAVVGPSDSSFPDLAGGMIAFSSIFSIPLDDSAARARTRMPFKSTPFLAATTETRLIMQEASVEPSKTPGEGNSARPLKEASRSVANVTLEGIKVVSQRNCPTFSVSEV